MKLKPIKQLLLKINLSYYKFYVILIFVCLQSINGYAQEKIFTFEKTNLSDALVQLSHQQKIDIAFDAQKLKEIPVHKKFKADNNNQALGLLLEGTGYTYLLKYNSYLIVKDNTPVKKEIAKKYRLTGTIIDRETGENLPYANVFSKTEQKNISGTQYGTFSFSSLKDTLQLSINYLGFFQVDTTLILSDTSTTQLFYLKRKSVLLSNVNVNAGKLKMISVNVADNRLTLNPESFQNLPNFGETDVLRTLQFLPGVAANENSAQINIRGGSADQNLVLLDGFTLYNLDHFFGSFSIINPNIVKDIQIFRGGYDSRYGERVSGIIDITGKTGTKKKATVYGGINTISANLTTEIPIGKKINMIAAYRRTYNSVYETPVASRMFTSHFGNQKQPMPMNTVYIKPDYYFWDFNSKLSYKVNPGEIVSFSGYASADLLTSSNNSQMQNRDHMLNIATADKNEWKNYGLSANWMKQLNKSFFINLQTGYSGYSNYYKNTTLIEQPANDTTILHFLPERQNNFITKENNELTDFSFSFKNTWSPSLTHQFDFGFSSRYNNFNFLKNADEQFVYSNLKQSANLLTIFAQDKYTPVKNITIKPGFRLNYYSKTTQLYFEPRLLVALQANQHITFKASAGRYYQYLSKVSADLAYGYNRDFWILSDTTKHPVVKSNHYIIGTNITLGNFSFEIEAYFKDTKGIQQYLSISNFLRNSDFHDFFPKNNPPQEKLPPSRFVTGNANSKGLDMMLKYESDLYTGWISYSLSKSVQKFKEINNNQFIPAPFDQRHKIAIANMLTIRNWKFSFTYIFTNGQSYIKNNVTNRNLVSQRVYDFLPNYNRADISAGYTFSLRKCSFTVGGSVINLFNNKNYFDIYTRQFDFQNNNFSQTTITEAQKFSPNIYINFKF